MARQHRHSYSATEAQRLKSQLLTVRQLGRPVVGPPMHVPGVGRNLSAAYEQLRNAAEYTEDNLLLQRTIRRFYTRNLSFHHRRTLGNIGEELIIELTQAGYLENDTIGNDIGASIQRLAKQYMEAYWQLRRKRVSNDEANHWTLDILSVYTAELLISHSELSVFAYFAYEHCLKLLPKADLTLDPIEDTYYEISLYIAVHQALLKSDLATVRGDLLKLYRKSPEELGGFIQFNRDITHLFHAPLTQRLRRAINRYGAPLRILKRLIEENRDLADALDDRLVFLALYEQQTFREYRAARRRLSKGLGKSIVFLLITKAIIGIGIEIPYDIATAGSIALMPLGINLLFPPLYMASLKLGLQPPSVHNAQALHDYIDKALFTEGAPISPSVRSLSRSLSGRAKVAYGVVVLIPFIMTVFLLSLLHFNIVQMIVFFIFLSTASFLGFRLSQTVREIEIVRQEVGLGHAVRDFFYLPFVMTGQWLSAKYARANIVGMLLDMLIELPLKTVLRLIRQWLRFLSERREQIY